MDGQIKSKEQLIKELEDLQQMYDSLKAISDADNNRLKLTEEKLSKLEHRNRAWLENSLVCTQIIDLDFNLQYMSNAGIKDHQIDDITSYYGKTYPFHFYPESFKTGMKGNMLRAIETGKVITLEAPVVDVNGHELWYRSTIVPVKDNTDLVDSLMIVSLDTTEQKTAEKNNNQSEEKYRQLADHSPSIVYRLILKPERRFEYVSPSTTEITGYSPEEHYADPQLGYKLIHPDDRKLFTDITRYSHGEPLELRCIKKDGSVIWTEQRNVLLFDENNDLVAIEGQVRDITAQKLAEEALKDSMQLLERTMYSLLDAVFIIDSDTVKILDCNAAASTIFGYSREEMLGQTTTFLHVDEASLEGFRQQLYSDMETGKEYMFLPEYKMKHKDGTLFFSEHSVVPLKNKQGQRIGWVSVVRDITERKLSKAIFKDIVEKNPMSIQILDMDGYPIQVNSAHTNLFGVKPPADYSVFKDHQLLSLGFDEFFGRIKKGEVVYFPATFYNVNDVDPSFPDSPVWVKAVGFTLNDNNGKPEKIVFMHENITESKIAEKELIAAKEKAEESEEKYRLLFENANEAIYIVQNEKLVFTNPACEQLSGISKDNLIGFSISDLVDENDKENLLNHHYDLIKGITQNQNSIFTIINQEGLKRHLSINSVLINWNGLPATLNFGTDITDSKKAELELMAQRQIYEQILEQSLAGYWDWDILSGYEYLSPTFKKMFGYEDDEIENRAESWQKLIFSEDLPAVYEEFNKHIESKGIIPYYNEVRYHHKNGSIIWVICTGKVIEWDDNGKPMRMIGCHIDITARKQIEQELNRAKEKAQESEQRLFTYINSIPDVICYKDGDGKWLLANNADLELFCLQGVDYHGKTDNELSEYTHEIYKDAFKNCMESDERAWEQKTISIGIEIIPTAKGEKRVYEVIKVPVFQANGKRKGLAVIGRDITKLYETQDNLLTAKEKAEESDRLKSAFLANMSHEIRTPMNGILGFAEILKDPDLTGDQQQEYIKIIEKSGNRMLNIINDIVDISKIEAGLMKVNLTESNINEQIEYIYTFFKPEVESKGMKLLINITLSAQEATILTDREKVYAIFTNLVKNAIKYSREGSIEIGYTRVETLHATSLQFFVKDTGIGIPLDRQKAIFERFIQADITDKMARQGAGLGLAITKSHVEMLGGKIWVESLEGEGSTFYFTLPYNQKHEVDTFAQSSVSSIEKYHLQKRVKILIAEDDPTSEMLISLMVTTFGREILKVQTGTAAIEACRQNPDIDLILMDIQMPQLGGYEATRQIRGFNKDVVIIAQTAFGLSGDREKAIEAGCNDYISKPINKMGLQALIHKYFDKRTNF